MSTEEQRVAGLVADVSRYMNRAAVAEVSKNFALQDLEKARERLESVERQLKREEKAHFRTLMILIVLTFIYFVCGGLWYAAYLGY